MTEPRLGRRPEGAFVGRSAELAEWTRLINSLPDRGGVLVLAGEPGIGKSRLQGQLNAVASAARLPVLRLRCRESDLASAYRPLIEALAPLSRPDGPLSGEVPPAYRPALAMVSSLWESDRRPIGEDVSPALAESTVRILGLIAARRGLVLAVDDVQWADPDTFAVLEHLARTADAAPVAVSVTARTGVVGVERIGSLGDAVAVTVLELRRLDDAEQEQLITSLLGADVPSAVIDFVATRAEGLPLVIEELATELVRIGALARREGGWEVHGQLLHEVSAPAIERSVRARLVPAGPDATAVAVALALRDEDSTWDDIAVITAQTGDRAAACLQQLADVDLLVPVGRGRYRYRHQLIRDAVLATAPPSTVAKLAGRAAAALSHAENSDPGAAALAAVLWARAGEPDEAARAHLAAASRWLARGASPTAEVAARAALAGARSSALRTECTDVLSEALTRTGRFADALVVLEDMLRDPGPASDSQLARAHCRAARCALETGDAPAARRHLDAAEGLGGTTHEVCSMRATLAFEARDSASALELAARALKLAEAVAEPHGLGAALLVQARVLRSGDPEDALPGLERLALLAEQRDLPALRERALLELGLIDRLTGNRTDRLLEAHQLAVQHGSLHTQTVAETNMWSALMEAGDLAAAEQAIRSAVGLSARYRLRTLAAAAAQLAMYEASRGRLDAAAAAVELVRAEDPRFAAGAELYLELYRGEPERAWACIAPAADALNEAPDARPAPARGLHALLAAVLGDDPEPAQRVIEVGVGAWYNRGLALLARAVVAGRSGDRPAAEVTAAAAMRDLGHTPSLEALAVWLCAEAAVADGWGDPSAWLGRARRQFDVLGAEILRHRCDALMRAAGYPIPRRGRGDAEVPRKLQQLGITSREMDVLLLVAERLTNAQIAERLTLSPRTVDTHVSHLIAKAGVSGRNELAGLIG